MANEFVARNGVIAQNNSIITGSLTVTGGITGSSALISGTITAQTLVVSIISSSIEYSSGSNIFGSLSTNTQQFTGSVSITGSLVITGSVNASQITGSLFGTSSFAVSASWAPGSSGGLTTKANAVANTSFTGNPQKTTVTFSSAFPSTNYSIVVTGGDLRSWTIESKLAGSFVINSNSNVALINTTYWQAVAYGEA